MAIARRPAHFLLVDQAPEADVENGQLRIPDRPGLGINLVPDRVGPFLWTEVGL
jgi:galactonate dehydratase